MPTLEQVAELEAAEAYLAKAEHGLKWTVSRDDARKWQLAINYAQARLTRARAACIGEQEMPGGEGA